MKIPENPTPEEAVQLIFIGGCLGLILFVGCFMTFLGLAYTKDWIQDKYYKFKKRRTAWTKT